MLWPSESLKQVVHCPGHHISDRVLPWRSLLTIICSGIYRSRVVFRASEPLQRERKTKGRHVEPDGSWSSCGRVNTKAHGKRTPRHPQALFGMLYHKALGLDMYPCWFGEDDFVSSLSSLSGSSRRRCLASSEEQVRLALIFIGMADGACGCAEAATPALCFQRALWRWNAP